MLIGNCLPASILMLLLALSGDSARFVGLAAAESGPKDNSKAEKTPSTADAEAIDKLIARLGADSFAEREEAIKRLIAVGPAALDALRRTADDKRVDPDVRLRAARAAYAIATVKIEMVRRLGEHNPDPGNPTFRWATRVAISPDGKHAITAGVAELRYWDLNNNYKLIRSFGTNKRGYWSVSFSSDGRRVIAGARNNNLCLFDVNTGNLLKEMTGHTMEIWGAAFTADGKQAISGSWDRSIRVWDLETGKQVRAFNVRDQVRGFALSPDGKLLAASHFAAVNGPGTIRLWDVQKGTSIRALTGHQLEISQVSFSPDGKLLVSSSFDKTVRIWRVADGKEIKILKGQNGRIEGAVFTPNGQRVVSCCTDMDPTLRMWDVATGKQLGESDKTDQGFLALAALHDGKHALTTGKDGTVRLWRWMR